jgi:hypothetical protein
MGSGPWPLSSRCCTLAVIARAEGASRISSTSSKGKGKAAGRGAMHKLRAAPACPAGMATVPGKAVLCLGSSWVARQLHSAPARLAGSATMECKQQQPQQTTSHRWGTAAGGRIVPIRIGAWRGWKRLVLQMRRVAPAIFLPSSSGAPRRRLAISCFATLAVIPGSKAKTLRNEMRKCQLSCKS